MKKIGLLFLLVCLTGCDSEHAINCLQTTGKPVSKTFELPIFTKIFAGSRVKLFLTYGEKQEVTVKTGKNLLNDVAVSVKDGQLYLENENACNLVRDYKETKIYVTSPRITYIRNGSPYAIESTNVLKYPELKIVSEDEENEDEFHTDGDFKLQLDCDEVKIVNNNISNYFLSGRVGHLFVGFYAGDGRLEAGALIAQRIDVFHRGTNKIIVNPQEYLKGSLYSTGDLIAVHRPNVVEVEELYKGKLIFK